MTKKYRYEPKFERGCGKRKIGGLYLVGDGISFSCDRLPYNLELCPTCGSGLKQQRNFQWIDWYKYAGKHNKCECEAPGCPICKPIEGEKKYGLLWVGNKYYTPQAFVEESLKHGISKRIPWVPKELELGKTWILFAHPDAGETKKKGKQRNLDGEQVEEREEHPAIFYAFKPKRVEKLVKEGTPQKELDKLEKAGITPVLVKKEDVAEHDEERKHRRPR